MRLPRATTQPHHDLAHRHRDPRSQRDLGTSLCSSSTCSSQCCTWPPTTYPGAFIGLPFRPRVFSRTLLLHVRTFSGWLHASEPEFYYGGSTPACAEVFRRSGGSRVPDGTRYRTRWPLRLHSPGRGLGLPRGWSDPVLILIPARPARSLTVRDGFDRSFGTGRLLAGRPAASWCSVASAVSAGPDGTVPGGRWLLNGVMDNRRTADPLCQTLPAAASTFVERYSGGWG